MKKAIVIEMLTAVLILLFLYSASSKLFDMRGFYIAMHNQPFPLGLSQMIAWILPFVELATALLLIPDRTRLIALYIALSLLSVFTLYIILILCNVFGRVPCSCGGVIQQLSWQQHLWFNVFFILITVTAIFLKKNRLWKDRKETIMKRT